MKLFIEPVDVWMFRDGRPFDAGEDHLAASRFPPHPTVMQGALRSHHLVVKGVDLTDSAAIRAAVGTASDYGPLRMRGPFLARREDGTVTRYHPLPADAAIEDGQLPARGAAQGGGLRARPVKPREAPSGVIASVQTALLLWPEDEPRKVTGSFWLREDRLAEYLAGRSTAVTSSAHLFAFEDRLGIGRDDHTRTAREGALYQARFVRPCPEVGLDLVVHGLEGWPPNGVVRMGGEGRGGRYCASNSAEWPAPPTPLPRRFKLYMATPALFERGWQPGEWGRFFAGAVTLRAAAIRGFEAVGGFDMAEAKHKASRRYVPAGSVYFFECDGPAHLRPGLVNDAVTDDGAEIGFGQILIGEW